MQEEVTVNFRGEQITLRVPQGTSDGDIQRYLERQAAPEQKPAAAPTVASLALPPGAEAVNAFLTSASNSALLGAPEMILNQFGGAPAYAQMRKDSPLASAAGDAVGLINPARLAMKYIPQGINALRNIGSTARTGGTAADTAKILQTSEPELRAMAAARQVMGPSAMDVGRAAVRRAGTIGAGVIGAQTGAAALGAARTPENPMAGAQQGATTFQNMAQQVPGAQLIPGAQQTIGAVTSVVPGGLAYGEMLKNYITIEQRMREEAAKRALQGQQ
jgi:hypothetical protein